VSSGLQRVSFRFGRETEVRYLAQVPEIGDHVTHGNAIWVISEVEQTASERSSPASFRRRCRTLDAADRL